MATSVAKQLVEDLRDSGVQRIYGLVGDSINLLADAADSGGCRHDPRSNESRSKKDGVGGEIAP
jgi:thiamine pyrophosphate-dependent acetolactate synthase large subunit-like protein